MMVPAAPTRADDYSRTRERRVDFSRRRRRGCGRGLLGRPRRRLRRRTHRQATRRPVDYTAELTSLLLGLFGDEDKNPTPAQVDTLEASLKDHRKNYEFHRYPDAGHGFFYHDRPAAYRAEAAVDGWAKVWDFLGRHFG